MNTHDPFAWVEKGDRDLTLCKDMLANAATYPDLICYHTQQAAEKYLKAIILYEGLTIKRTHDLEELLDFISTSKIAVTTNDYNEAIKINDYAVLMRYPGLAVDPTIAEVLEAIAAAEHFRYLVKQVLGV